MRHPGPVIGTNEGTLATDMGYVLLLGAISMTILVSGHVIAGMRLARLELLLEELQDKHEGVSR